jgi:predicted porin
MKRNLTKVLGCVCVVQSAVAGAQSSVTPSGPHSVFSTQGGYWGTSMLNMNGTEELGGGNRAFFFLSQGFNVTTGTQASSYRKSFVGLSSDRYGSVKLGRDLFIANGVAAYDPFVQEQFSSGSLVHNRNGQKTSNNVSYQTPSYAGFDLYSQYSLSGQAGNFNGGVAGGYGRSDGVQLTYRTPLFDIRAIFDEMRDINGHFSNVFTSSREYMVGSNVHFGNLTLQGMYSLMDAPDTPAGLARRATHIWFGANYLATPALQLTGAVYRIMVGDGAADATHDGHGHATLFEIGSTYSLSKRTFLYATAGYVRNGSASTFSVEPNNPGLNNSNLANPTPGRSQTGFYTGINHSF